MSQIAGIPDEVFSLLVAQDAKHGFPPGTMASILQQEVGGQLDKFLGDPTAYHYGLAADGVRRTKDGTVSTAFGPFGILDSTAKDPGWGVQPLQDKASLEEQIRFASDYLAARVRNAGDFEQGIASYGQGKQYAQSVLGRIGGYPTPEAAQPVAVAQAPAPVPVPEEAPVQIAALPGSQEVPPQWEAFRNWVPRHEPPVRDPRQPHRAQPVVAARPADFSESLGMARTMMEQNQATMQNGWDTLRGWA